MKTLITAIALSLSTTAAFAAPSASDGLFELATTGWADNYASEVSGLAFDETGGAPGEFTYAVPVDLSMARDLLNDAEFLAPHFAISPNGDITVMVAPHLLTAKGVMKGANKNKDHFIVISGGSAERFDYSEDIENK